MMAQIRDADTVILLDERGEHFSSSELAVQLAKWLNAGRDLCFLIGGADGVSAEIAERANLSWALARLTLPHGLARVLFVEQLHRAWSINEGHPYHRE